MKRILLYVDELGSGGAQRQIVALARLLKSKGYNVRLVDYWDNTFYDNELTQLGIPFYHANVKGKWNIIKPAFCREFRNGKRAGRRSWCRWVRDNHGFTTSGEKQEKQKT